MVRLHVVANSDSQEDQAVKLRVRDAVLAKAAPWLEGAATREEAAEILAGRLDELAQAGAEAAGEGVAVTASLEENAWFPTKEYTDFALPAGKYTALRVTLGEGEGRNWWCVVFPPLCLGSVTETVAERAGNFSEDQVSLITGESGGYVVKFRAMELWDSFCGWLEGGERMEGYVCTVCGYIYDPAKGDLGNLPPGTLWDQVPQDWTCPVCGVGKELFEEKG